MSTKAAQRRAQAKRTFKARMQRVRDRGGSWQDFLRCQAALAEEIYDMKALYNCKEMEGGGWTITKFDTDMNVEASYRTTYSECECPRGNKSTCRHRNMLPLFVGTGHVGDGWLLDYDTRQWVTPLPEALSAAGEASAAGPNAPGPNAPIDLLPSAEEAPERSHPPGARLRIRRFT